MFICRGGACPRPDRAARSDAHCFRGDPTYDNQQSLFTTWLSELDNAIKVLSDASLANQETYGASDIYYKGDWSKWVMLANTLKLRIAVRLENQDKAKTQLIFQQVMQDATGPISSNAAQVIYKSTTYTPFGNDINYRSPRYGTTSIVNFLKSVNDPRLGIYFSKNDLVGSFKDTLTDPKVKLGVGNDLERIYIQQYLNFYRLSNEAYVFVRRTGFPKTGSNYYARETFNEIIPRRWWTTDPGVVNRANWTSALTEQGFTPNAQDILTLSTQRVWYDKTAPEFGKGN